MGPPEDEKEVEEVGEWYGVDTRICGVNSVRMFIRCTEQCQKNNGYSTDPGK